jgi:hypothetical protein
MTFWLAKMQSFNRSAQTVGAANGFAWLFSFGFGFYFYFSRSRGVGSSLA